MGLTIAIDRAGLSLADLVLSGTSDAETWGILPGFTLPGQIANVVYAESPFLHGSVATHATWQQAVLSFDAMPSAADGAALSLAVEELREALAQFSYEVTVTLNSVDYVWTCDMGSLSPSPLDFPEVDANRPIFSVSIPCYPVPTLPEES